MYRGNVDKVEALIELFNKKSPFKINKNDFIIKMNDLFGRYHEGQINNVATEKKLSETNNKPDFTSTTPYDLYVIHRGKALGDIRNSFTALYTGTLKKLSAQYAQKIYDGKQLKTKDKEFAMQYHSLMNQIYEVVIIPDLKKMDASVTNFPSFYNSYIHKQASNIKFSTIDDYRIETQQTPNADIIQALSQRTSDINPASFKRNTTEATADSTKLDNLIQAYSVLKERNQKRNFFSWLWNRSERNALSAAGKKLSTIQKNLGVTGDLKSFIAGKAKPSPKITGLSTQINSNYGRINNAMDSEYKNTIDKMIELDKKITKKNEDKTKQIDARIELKRVYEIQGLNQEQIHKKLREFETKDKNTVRKEVVKQSLIIKAKNEGKVLDDNQVTEAYNNFVIANKADQHTAYDKLLEDVSKIHEANKLGQQLENEPGMTTTIYNQKVTTNKDEIESIQPTLVDNMEINSGK